MRITAVSIIATDNNATSQKSKRRKAPSKSWSLALFLVGNLQFLSTTQEKEEKEEEDFLFL